MYLHSVIQEAKIFAMNNNLLQIFRVHNVFIYIQIEASNIMSHINLGFLQL
jgi:hypothetical protein